MKVKDIIAKQEEYRQILKAKEELELFRKEIDALYDKTEALNRVSATIRLVEFDIMAEITTCAGKLKKQLEEMEV